MPETPQVEGLKATKTVNGVDLSWSLSNTNYLTGVDVLVEVVDGTGATSVLHREALPPTARSLPVTGLSAGSKYRFNVRAQVEVGGATVDAEPAPEEKHPLMLGVEADGKTLQWNAEPGVSEYTLATVLNPKTTRNTTYQRVHGTTFAPPPQPGREVNYGLHIAAPVSEGAWATEVTIIWPPVSPTPVPNPNPEPTPIPAGAEETVLNASHWGTGLWADIVGVTRRIRESAGSVTDEEMNAMYAAGIGIGTVLFNEGGKIGDVDPQKEAEREIAFFDKYGVGGTFYRGKHDYGCRVSEPFNEPDGSWFWSDNTNYSHYTAVTLAVRDAFAQHYAPERRPVVTINYGRSSWIDGTMQAGILKGKLGLQGLGIVCHPYGGASGSNGGALGNRAACQDAHEKTHLGVYITEVGWPTALGQPSTGDSQQWSEAAQSEYIAKIIEWGRATPWIRMVTIFGYRDYGTNNFYGIESHSGRRKPSYYRMKSLLEAAHG